MMNEKEEYLKLYEKMKSIGDKTSLLKDNIQKLKEAMDSAIIVNDKTLSLDNFSSVSSDITEVTRSVNKVDVTFIETKIV